MNSSAIELLLSDNTFKVRSADELRRELDIETAKTVPDTDVINELVLSIIEAEIDNKNIANSAYEVAETHEKTIRVKRSRMRNDLIAAAAVIVLMINISVFALIDKKVSREPEKNILLSSLGYEADERCYIINSGGDSIVLNQVYIPKSNAEASESDPYGIKEYCTPLPNNFDKRIEAPEWLPEDLTVIEKDDSKVNKRKICFKSDENGKRCVDFRTQSSVVNFKGIPEYLRNIELNGHEALLLKFTDTDTYALVFYREDGDMIIIRFIGLSNDEVYKIIESID